MILFFKSCIKGAGNLFSRCLFATCFFAAFLFCVFLLRGTSLPAAAAGGEFFPGEEIRRSGESVPQKENIPDGNNASYKKNAPAGERKERRKDKTLTVLFTNDMHSGTVPLGIRSSARENGREGSLTDGGYARLATLLEREIREGRKKGAVVVADAGDIAMGTLFHTVFREVAFEYRILGKLGYDVFVFGNHDFDLGPSALAQMLETGVSSGGRLPVLLSANLRAREGTSLEKAIRRAGGKGFMIAERDGIRTGLFGLMGEHARSVIVCRDSLSFTPPLEAAREMVRELEKEKADFIIAVSHGGTLYGNGRLLSKQWERSEDGRLAARRPGLDAVISGHDHRAMESPVFIGNVPIVSAGSHNRYLGKLVLKKQEGALRAEVDAYELIPISDTVAPHPGIRAWIDSVWAEVDKKLYLQQGVRALDTAGTAPRELGLSTDSAGNLELGAYVAAAYREALLEKKPELASGGLVGIVPYGSLRAGLEKGPVTYERVFNVLSLGEGPDGRAGYPLVSGWLSGKEIKDLCELNATVAPGMEDARLFFSGLQFTWDPRRPPFFKVTDVRIGGKPLEKNALYPVVTGMYTAELMGLLRSASYGILSVTPKDENGRPVENPRELITEEGTDVSEWMAFARFIGKGGLEREPETASFKEKTGIGKLLWIYVPAGLLLLLPALPVIWLVRRSRKRRAAKGGSF